MNLMKNVNQKQIYTIKLLPHITARVPKMQTYG